MCSTNSCVPCRKEDSNRMLMQCQCQTLPISLGYIADAFRGLRDSRGAKGPQRRCAACENHLDARALVRSNPGHYLVAKTLCQLGPPPPHAAPGIIRAHDSKRPSRPQARTWLARVSYVFRTCLVHGGSSAPRKTALFGRFRPPGPRGPFTLLILAGWPTVPHWHTCPSGCCSGQTATARTCVKLLIKWVVP